MKIGTAAQRTGSPARTNGDSAMNSSVDDGMLSAAPATGEMSRSPRCVSTNPAPRKNAEAKASATARLFMGRLGGRARS